MTPNIAFIGKMGSGKTTAAQYLVRRYGYEAVHMAAPLKRIAAELWPENGDDRDRLQRLGIAVRRIDRDTWVDLAARTIDQLEGPVVVDDCRFPNEYEALAERGFRFVEIICEETARVDRLMRIGRLQDHSQLRHESETALDDRALYPVDATIYSRDDIDHTVAQLDGIMAREAARV